MRKKVNKRIGCLGLWMLILAILFTGLQVQSSVVYAASSYLHTTLLDANSDNIIDSIKLDWVDTSNSETQFKIERTDDIDNTTYYYYAPANSITYTDNSIILGRTYTYKVFTMDIQGVYSEYSEIAKVNTSQVVSSNPSALQLTLKDNGLDSKIDSIRLNWNDSSNEAYYRVERKDNTDNSVVTFFCAMNSTQYTDNTVNPLHTYTFTILHYDNQGNSYRLTEAVIVNLAQISVPSAPLTAIPVSSSQIELTWKYSVAISYGTVIERRTNGGTWALVGSVENGKTIFRDENLPTNTLYYYRLRAVLGSNVQVQLTPDNDLGVSAYTMLTTPSNIYGYALSSTQITLTWTDIQEETGFIIQRKDPNADDFVSLNNGNPVAANTTNWTDINLVPDSTYIYRIKAVTDLGNTSLYTNEILISTTFINQPSNLSAVSTPDLQVKLSWMDNSSSETGFEIWRKTNKNSAWVNYKTVSRNVITFADGDINENTVYYYKIRAKNTYKDAFSNFSNEASANATALNSPTDLQANIVSAKRIDLSWVDNSGVESGFKIERRIGIDGDWDEIASTEPNVTFWSDINIDTKKQYFYRIKVYESVFYNSVGYSDEIEAMTDIPVPPSGTHSLSLSPTKTKIIWSDNSNNEKGFVIERSSDTNLFYVKIVQTEKNVSQYIDSTAQPQRKYYYRVKAINQLGDSAYSNFTSVITKQVVSFKDVSISNWARNEILSIAGGGAFKVKTGGLFEPNKKITRGEFLYALVKTFKLSATAVGSLSDVKPSNTYYKEIMISKKLGIVSPNRYNYFYPNSNLSRKEMVIYLSKTLKAINKPLTAFDESILDEYSDKDSLPKETVSYFSSIFGYRIMEGKIKNQERFMAPNDATSRAEAAVVIYRALETIH